MKVESYRHIGPRPGSSYRQYFVNGTRTRAETIYRYTIGPDAQTAQQVADDCDLPLEAVNECIRYCLTNADLVREESAADWRKMAKRGFGQEGNPLTAKAAQ